MDRVHGFSKVLLFVAFILLAVHLSGASVEVRQPGYHIQVRVISGRAASAKPTNSSWLKSASQ